MGASGVGVGVVRAAPVVRDGTSVLQSAAPQLCRLFLFCLLLVKGCDIEKSAGRTRLFSLRGKLPCSRRHTGLIFFLAGLIAGFTEAVRLLINCPDE